MYIKIRNAEKDCSSPKSKRRCCQFAAVILVSSILFLTASCSSFRISDKQYQTFAEQLQSNIKDLIPSVVPSEGGFQIPDKSQITEIGSKQDLFFVLQDGLYQFLPEIYIQIETYDLFSEYWSELSADGALHSAFEKGEVRIEYEDASPCVMKLIFQYNDAGQILQKHADNEPMVFTDAAVQTLYNRATDILAEIVTPDMTDLQKESAIHNYIVIHSQYSVAGDLDALATADSVLISGIGQCQGYAEAFALLGILSGMESRVVSGAAYNGDGVPVAHAWNQIKLNDIWYHVDVTWDDPVPDTGNYVTETYINRSDEFMKKDHSWSGLFIVCPIDAPVTDASAEDG